MLLQHVLVVRASNCRCKTTGGFWGPYSTFIVISLGYGVVAGSLVSFVEPLAGGSGIPEIKTYLNGIHIRRVAPHSWELVMRSLDLTTAQERT